jgi:hypothetical protein
MGILPGLRKKKTSVREDPAIAISEANASDPEKDAVDHAETTRAPALQFVDPAIERRVVRKLDYRLVPLVMGLCE